MIQNTQIMAAAYAAILMGAWSKGAPQWLLEMLMWVVIAYITKEGLLAIAKLIWPEKKADA